MSSILRRLVALTVLLVAPLFAQETTGGLQGIIKEASGAVVASAQVVVTGSSMIGSKQVVTDNSGYYRFANLPPGTYKIVVTAKGFSTAEQSGLVIEVGHLPSIDFVLQVGTSETVVDVSAEGALVDTTTQTTQTNIEQDVMANVPHGRSFQSMIQFAPSARNEPLMGSTGGTGGSMPGSSGNGLSVGYSIGGAADSENSYLVEGQDTENITGGYSKANVPYQFIEEVQIKTSGIEAEHGGALGGVANVIMKKGSNNWHGSVFGTYEGSRTDANQNSQYLRYDPTASVVNPATNEPQSQVYSPQKDNFNVFQPGFTIGGPLIKDKLFLFAGFAPFYDKLGRNVNFNPAGSEPVQQRSPTIGMQHFNQDESQYYATGRLDFAATQKIRLFSSWLYQYSRETGASIPLHADPSGARLPECWHRIADVAVLPRTSVGQRRTQPTTLALISPLTIRWSPPPVSDTSLRTITTSAGPRQVQISTGIPLAPPMSWAIRTSGWH